MRKLRKSLAVILAVLMIMSSVSICLPSVSALSASPEEYRAGNSTPTIDGVLGDREWSNGYSLDSSNSATWVGDSIVGNVTFYFAWGEDGLYFAADVADAEIAHTRGQATDADCLQFALNPGFQSGSQGIFYSFGIKEDNNVAAYRSNYEEGNITNKITGACKINDQQNAYVMEVMVPWNEINVADVTITPEIDAHFNALVAYINRNVAGDTIAYKTVLQGYPTSNFKVDSYALNIVLDGTDITKNIKDSAIFDLNFNYNDDQYDTELGLDSGAFVNKVEDGLGFYNVLGTALSKDGKDCIRTYGKDSSRRVATTATQGLLTDDGLTIEMDVFIDPATDVAVLFRDDKASNTNLIRTEDTIYIGCENGNDVTVEASAIPEGEWVHLLLTEGVSGQKLYVNGVKVASGTEEWTYASENRLGFIPTSGTVIGETPDHYLAMARIYDTELDPETADAVALALYNEYVASTTYVNVAYDWVSAHNPSDVALPINERVLAGVRYTAGEQQATALDSFTFDGWYTDPTMTQRFNNGTILREDTTLYGAWTYSGQTSGTIASKDDTKAVENAVAYTELPIGGWVTPKANVDYSDFVDRYTKLHEAGLNYMITVDEVYSMAHTAKSVAAAYEAGMDIYYNPILTHFDLSYSIDKINAIKSWPAVKGFWFGDEPSNSRLEKMIPRSLELMAALNTDEFLYGANLFPNYAPMDDYVGYLDAYAKGLQKTDNEGDVINNLSANMICVDYYPFGEGTGDFMPGLVENISQMKTIADKYDLDMYSYIQSSGWAGRREPNQKELLYDVHMNLATGVKGLVYYLACKTGSYTAMLEDDGSYGTSYFKVQQTNAMIEKFKGVYLDFDNEGYISIGDGDLASKVEAVNSDYILDSYKQLKKADASKAFIGCFTKGENDNQQTGLYVVNQNYDTNSNSEVYLEFDGAVTYQIWGSKGLEQMGTAEWLTLNITPGDAKFVIINSVNSAEGYTPVEPEPERPDLDTARANSLVFDLGYDDEGNIYNEKTSGVALIDGAAGTVEEIEGSKALSTYNFQTDYANDVCSDNGVTVELEIMFTGTGDDTVYTDTVSNFNFFRWEETGQIWFGLSDGDDVAKKRLTADDIDLLFPKNQWLHVVATQSKGSQSIYVNGTEILSGTKPYDPLRVSSILFTSEGDIKLRDAKIYTYSADQNEAALMYKDYMGEPTELLDGFEDLKDGAWYTDALESVVRRNLFGGITETEFAPDMDMTRSMFVMVLSRLNGVDLENYTPSIENPFTDVTSDQWFYKAVMWAYENELVNGMTEDTFGPDGKITREQMCVLMVRFAEKYNYDLSETTDPVTFEDEGLIGSWALEAVKTCQKAGLVTGMTATTFVPGGNASRAQVATIFTRLMAK